jgi:hypothetical protein
MRRLNNKYQILVPVWSLNKKIKDDSVIPKKKLIFEKH